MKEAFNKWNIYLKERSPLPALLFISALGALSSLSFKSHFDACLFFMGIIFNTLIFIQLRLADEIKDFEKDKIVNPGRPLPRGLLKVSEVYQGLLIITSLVVFSGLILGFLKSWPAGMALMVTSLFGWLMYKEFYAGKELSKSPIVYAITHQVIVLPLYMWLGLATDADLIYTHEFQGWLLANFGASFTFEICRKLNPDAHKLAATYAQHYGNKNTALICSFFILLMGAGAFMTGFGLYIIVPLMVLQFFVMKWIEVPKTYKRVEALATVCALIVVLSPALMWLVRSWRST